MISAAYDRQTTIGAKLATTAATAVYTVDKGFINITHIHVANLLSTDVPVTISWYDTSEAKTFNLLYQHPVPGNCTFGMDMSFWPNESDEIRITAGTANAIDAFVTFYQGAGRNA